MGGGGGTRRRVILSTPSDHSRRIISREVKEVTEEEMATAVMGTTAAK